jgi:hypothetical protein
MESVKTLNKGLALDTFKVLSATAALSLSLIVYAMHDYFNLFGTAHAIVFTVLVFYGLAATGYYMLCFKHAGEYELPTVATRLVSLVFYTSIGFAVFFAYKIYINSPLDYVIAFFAGCIIGGFIKDITSFVVYANQDLEKTFKLLDLTSNLSVLSIPYFFYQLKSGVIEDAYFWGILSVIVLVNAVYVSARMYFLEKWDMLGSTFSLSCLISLINTAMFFCVNGVIYSIYFNLELALILMSIYLYISNIVIRNMFD